MRRLKKAPSRATVSRLPEVQSGTSAYRSTRLDEPKTNVEKSTYLPTQILELASCQVSKKRLRGLPYPGSQRSNPVPQHTVRLVSMSQKRMSKKYIPPDSNSRVGKLPSFKWTIHGLP